MRSLRPDGTSSRGPVPVLAGERPPRVSTSRLFSCKVCGGAFERRNSLHVACSPKCGIAYARQLNEKRAKNERQAIRRSIRAHRKANKPIRKLIAEASHEFNRWIRERDWGHGCISCGMLLGKVNAGHYRPAGAHAALRFDGANVHRQCERCNTYLSGNLVAYRQGLIAKIGVSEVERLEGPQPAVKWQREELIEIRHTYLGKWKALKAQREARN